MQGTRNLAHRMGRWSGLHPWKAIFGWVAFVLVAFAIGSVVPNHKLAEADRGVGDSGRAAKVVDRAFTDDQQPAKEAVFFQTRSGKLASADVTAVVADATRRLKASGVVGSIDPVERSTDG